MIDLWKDFCIISCCIERLIFVGFLMTLTQQKRGKNLFDWMSFDVKFGSKNWNKKKFMLFQRNLIWKGYDWIKRNEMNWIYVECISMDNPREIQIKWIILIDVNGKDDQIEWIM